MTKEVRKQLEELYEQIYFNKSLSEEEIFKYMEEEMELAKKHNLTFDERNKILYLYNITRDLNMPEGLALDFEDTEVDGKPAINLKVVKETK